MKKSMELYKLSPKEDSLEKVSIVIAAYNAANFISRAIMSVKAQTHGEWEIIVVDDASSDQTREIVKNFIVDDSRIRLFEVDRNQGPSNARNSGMHHAVGDWIAILDADDLFEPDRLQVLLRAACRYRADVVVDNLIFYDRIIDSRVGFAFNPEFPTRALAATEVLASERPWPGFRMGFLKPMFRRRMLSDFQIQYRKDIRHSEDLLLLVELIMASNAAIIVSTPGYVYSQQFSVRTGNRSETSKSVYDPWQRVEVGKVLLNKYCKRFDPKTRMAIEQYLRMTTDIAIGRDAIEGLRRRLPGSVRKCIAAGPRAIISYFVTLPFFKRLIRRVGLARNLAS